MLAEWTTRALSMNRACSVRESCVAPCVKRAWSLREPCVVTGGSMRGIYGAAAAHQRNISRKSAAHWREIRGTPPDIYLDTCTTFERTQRRTGIGCIAVASRTLVGHSRDYDQAAIVEIGGTS
jgi:hypothetical protein